MDIAGRFAGQLFWLNLCDQLGRDPIMDDSPPPYRQRMSSVEGARQLVQWYGADVTHQLLEVEEIKRSETPSPNIFCPCQNLTLAVETLSWPQPPCRKCMTKNSLLLITWKISIQQSSNNETHEARLQCKFYWSSVIVFVVSWLFLRQTDSEFCQREIKMAGGWKKLSSCLGPRWKRLSSQLLLLLVTSCGQRPVSGYSTVSHHFSPMGKPFKLHIMSKMEWKKLQIVQICKENGIVREAETLSERDVPKYQFCSFV